MKHLVPYSLFENADDNTDRLRRLVDLGLADRAELSGLYRTQFIQGLKRLFSELGVEWKDRATDRQQANQTAIIELGFEDALKLSLYEGLDDRFGDRRKKRLDKIRAEFLQAADSIRAADLRDSRPAFQYFIYPSGLRRANYYGKPGANPDFLFDGGQEPEELLVSFIYRVALDLWGYSYWWQGTSEALTDHARLVRLGLAEELTVGEWLRKLLDGDPDLQVETGTSTDRFSIHRPWSEHDLMISLIRVLSTGSKGRVWSFKIRTLNAMGDLGLPTEHELEAGLSNLEIAERILGTLRARWARPNALNERALGNVARLRELGLIPKFKNTWEEAKFHITRLWPELDPDQSREHTHSIELKLPNGLRIELERHHFGRYTWWILDQAGETLREQDWTPPRGLSADRDWDEAIRTIVGAANKFIESVLVAQQNTPRPGPLAP